MITFILPAFNEKHCQMVSLGSLLCQTSTNWKAIVYHNGHNAPLQAFVASLKDNRISYKETAENTGFWGCYNRIDALNGVTTKYVVQSSIQDYWLPTAVANILAGDEDIVMWNSINHLTGHGIVLDAQPIPGHTDWGNVAVKTELAKKVGIKYPEEYTADGLFIRDIMLELPRLRKINQVLTIHN